MNLFKFPFMQLYYLIQLLFMQLSYIIEYVYPCFHGLVVVTTSFFDVAPTWIGRVCIVMAMVCTICRLIYGKDAIDTKAGRLFVIGVEWVQCLCSPALEWYGRRMTKHHQRLRQEAFDKVPKDKDGILRAQNGIIQWTSFMRFMQGLVHNLFDEDDGPKEGAAEKLQRYQGCSMSECSDPEYWQSVHHGHDGDEGSQDDSIADEDWLANYISSRNSALRRARRGLEQAEVHSNYEMTCHYENIIGTLSKL